MLDMKMSVETESAIHIIFNDEGNPIDHPISFVPNPDGEIETLWEMKQNVNTANKAKMAGRAKDHRGPKFEFPALLGPLRTKLACLALN